MRRLIACALVAAAACGSPTAPAGKGAFSVRVVDDGTGAAITAREFGISVTVSGPTTATRETVNGVATFDGLESGTYRVSTDNLYGYFQPDLINVAVGSAARTIDVRLQKIDDLALFEVFVPGQGTIPQGGTVEVSPPGVTVVLRGEYRLVNYRPFSPQVGFFAEFVARPGLGSLSMNSRTYRRVSDTIWEAELQGVSPSTFNFQLVRNCRIDVDAIRLIMEDPLARAGAGTVIMIKEQKWPLTFRLGGAYCVQ